MGIEYLIYLDKHDKKVGQTMFDLRYKKIPYDGMPCTIATDSRSTSFRLRLGSLEARVTYIGRCVADYAMPTGSTSRR